MSFKKCRAQVTVFLALILLLVVSLLCVTAEAACSNAGGWYFRQAAQNAGESALASYESSLWEDYHLLMKDSDGLTEEIESYLSEYSAASDTSGVFFSFSEASVSVDGMVSAVDGGGEYFISNANAAMTFRGIADLASDLLLDTHLLKEIRRAAGFVQKYLSYAQKLIALQNLLASVNTAGSGMIEAARTLADCSGTLADALTDLSLVLSDPAAGEEKKEAAAITLSAAIDEMLLAQSTFSSRIDNLSQTIESYEKTAEEVGTAFNDLVLEMEGQKSSFRPAIWNLLQELVSSMKEYAETSEEKEEALTRLKGLTELTGELQELPTRLAQVSADGLTAEGAEELAGSLASFLTELGDYTGYEAPSWLRQMGAAGSSENGLLALLGNVLEGVLSDGFLGLFVEDTGSVSDRSISLSGLPSQAMRTEADTASGNLVVETVSRVRFLYYLTDTFSGYTQSGGSRLSYEWEYLVNGEFSDRDNLMAVTEELFLIRMGTRFLEFLQDEEKQTQAGLQAQAAVGFTGNEAAVYAVKMIYLSAWAARDARADVSSLLSGGEVPLLSIDGVEAVKADYEDYIRMELFLLPVEDLAYRAMDIITWTEKLTDSDFSMADCLVSFHVNAEGKRTWRFAALPFVTAGDGSSGVRYQWEGDFTY